MPRPESSSRIIASSALAVPRRRRVRSSIATSTVPIVDGYGRRRGSLTAAAQALTGPQASIASKINTRQWQTEVWGLRYEVPELRFVADRQASACSQCRMFIGKTPRPGDEPVPLDDTAPQVLRDLNESMFGQLAATQQSVFRAAQQIVHSGETELLLSLDESGEQWSWNAYAATEVTGSAVTGWSVKEGTTPRPIDPDRELLVRSWRPAPDEMAFADSPVRSLLPVLRELVSLTKFVSAQLDSRLAGNGMLLVPTGIKAMPGQFAEGDDNKPLTFAQQLAESMMVPLVDRDDASSMVPLIAEIEPQLIKEIRHLTFASTLDPHAAELRSELIRRIGLGMDTDPAVLLGQGDANHWCVDAQTEVYTRTRGWITEDALAVGDVVLTLNHETGLSEWQPVADIYRADVVDEPMRLMQTQRHNSLTTMGHRWPVLRPRWTDGTARVAREWTLSSDLAAPHAIITGAPSADLPDTAKWTDDLVELVGWYWTEGNLHSGGKVTTIAQSHTANPARVDRIRAALTRTFGTAGWVERIQRNDTSFGGPITVFALGVEASATILDHVHGRDKLVELAFVEALTLAQLELFIDISCQGDGWHYRHGRTDIWQKNPRALAAFERALILSGRSVSTHASADGVAVAGFAHTRQRPGKDRDGRRSFVTENYTGTVWCPTTANHSWFARRNGQSFFTGNSGWLIAEDEVRLSVAPVVAIICHSLTQFWLSTLLAEMGLSPAEAAQYQVWFDASPLELRPDRSKDAQTLHAAGIVSASTARRESGFGEDDIPDPAERRATVLEELLLARPDLAEAILPAMGINLALPTLAVTPPRELPNEPPHQTPEQPTGGDDGDVQFGTPKTLDAGPPE